MWPHRQKGKTLATIKESHFDSNKDLNHETSTRPQESGQAPGIGSPTRFVQAGNVVVETEVFVYFDAVENEDDFIGDDTVPSLVSLKDSYSTMSGGYQDSTSSSTVRKHKRLFPRRGLKQVKSVVGRLMPLQARRRKVGLSNSNAMASCSHCIATNDAPAINSLSTTTALHNYVSQSMRAVHKKAIEQKHLEPPSELPLRFLLACNNDPIKGWKLYEDTLAWRKKESIDTILLEAHPQFDFIKECYPQYFHLRGRNNEPCWYEKPALANRQAVKKEGISHDELARWYVLLTEFGWQYLEPDDMQKSISVIDLKGIKVSDFVGEVVDIMRKLMNTIFAHYPERSAYVFIVNVPLWFNLIWTVVKNFIDEETSQRVTIVRGEKEILRALLERIPMENIPPEYGGKSMPLGQSPEEATMKAFMDHINFSVCGGVEGGCHFCSWRPVRRY